MRLLTEIVFCLLVVCWAHARSEQVYTFDRYVLFRPRERDEVAETVAGVAASIGPRAWKQDVTRQ